MANDLKRMPVRCDPEDPHRCSYHGPKGQCNMLAIPDYANCPMHQHLSHSDGIRADLYNFKYDQLKKSLTHFTAHKDSRTLAQELALTRVMLEDAVNKFTENGQYDLLMNEATISRLLSNVRDTLTANTKLEERYGDLLSTDQVTTLMQRIFEVVASHVTDVETLNAIAYSLEALMEDLK